jgi:hypothetical protein
LRNLWSSANSVGGVDSSESLGSSGKSSLHISPLNVSYKVGSSKWFSPLSASSDSFITTVSKKKSSLKPFFYKVAFTSLSRCHVS